MSKYEAVYFVGDNQAVNRVRVGSFKTRNRGTFSGSLAALIRGSLYSGVQMVTDTSWSGKHGTSWYPLQGSRNTMISFKPKKPEISTDHMNHHKSED